MYRTNIQWTFKSDLMKQCLTILLYISDKGLGLALWKTGDAYEDIKFLAHHINENLFTALHNVNFIECNNDDKSCDEKLVNYFKSCVLQYFISLD